MSSGFRLVTIGKVMQNKEPGAEIILFIPIEILYDQPSGRIEDNDQTMAGDLFTVNQPNEGTEHKITQWTRARWRSMSGGNRMTPPDVYMNETVNIYQYGSNSMYYWDKIGTDTLLRGKEDIVFGASNREVGGDPQGETPTLENTAYIRMNTREGYFELRTPTNNGEASGYLIKLDFGGVMTIQDTNKNSIILESVDGKLTINTENEVIVNTKNAVINTETAEVNCDTLDVNANDQVTFNTPLVEMSQDVKIKGNLDVDGNITLLGTMDGNGLSLSGGNLTADGDITSKRDTIVEGDLTVRGTANGNFPKD